MEDLKTVYNKIVYRWLKTKPETTWGSEEIKSFIGLVEEGKVLDLGCAAGAHSKYLSNAGLEVIGIDFAEKMIEQAKTVAPKVRFLVMNISNLRFPDAYFDGIYARASLLHIKKDKIRQVLVKLREILKKDGIMYIALKEGEGERVVVDEENVSRFFAFYKEDEIKRLLQNTGFEIMSISYEKTRNNLWLQIFVKKV